MTAILVAILPAIAIIAAALFARSARKKVINEVVKGIEKIQDEAQKKIDAVPEVPKTFTKDEVRHALRVIRDSGRK